MTDQDFEDEAVNYNHRLGKMIENHGTFEDIPWGTMSGHLTTLGEMTDNHVTNSINHHYGMRYVILGRIGYLNRPDQDNDMDQRILQMNLDTLYAQLESCAFNEYLMREIQRRRGTDQDDEDYRNHR